MKNKILTITVIVILTIMLIIQVFSNKSFAEQTTANFKLNQIETKVGDKINVELILSNEVSFLSSDFVITYDTTKLNYVSYEKGNIQNFTIYANESSEGTIKIAGIQDPAESRTVAINTSLIVLQFDVIAGRGTESTIQLECNSLYKTETEKIETIETSSNVKILNISGIKGGIVTSNGFEYASAYLYEKGTNKLVDESSIDVNGIYNVEATSVGEYYIKIKKQGYLDYHINGINITQINNTTETLNDVVLIPGDLNGDGEIELSDLVELNDYYGTAINSNTVKANFSDDLYINSMDKQNILDNYTKKVIEVNIEDIGYQK